jgi:hypothetical protein
MKRPISVSFGTNPVPFVEILEPRQMMSVAGYQVSPEGHLLITGSARRDDISVSFIAKDDGSTVQAVVQNGSSKPKLLRQVIRGVEVNGRGGNDRITISGEGLSDLDNAFYVYLNGANGDDTIIVRNFDGAVQANGGAGNDTIDASAAFNEDAMLGPNSWRTLEGSDGNDVIRGSNANDQLDGGDGDDLLIGNDGDDYFQGGRGVNTMFGGGGEDTFTVFPIGGLYPDNPYPWHYGGTDTIDGGEDDDAVYRTTNSKLTTPPVFNTKISNVEKVVTSDIGDGNGKG